MEKAVDAVAVARATIARGKQMLDEAWSDHWDALPRDLKRERWTQYIVAAGMKGIGHFHGLRMDTDNVHPEYRGEEFHV